jgi:hypothetical protein
VAPARLATKQGARIMRRKAAAVRTVVIVELLNVFSC